MQTYGFSSPEGQRLVDLGSRFTGALSAQTPAFRVGLEVVLRKIRPDVQLLAAHQEFILDAKRKLMKGKSGSAEEKAILYASEVISSMRSRVARSILGALDTLNTAGVFSIMSDYHNEVRQLLERFDVEKREGEVLRHFGFADSQIAVLAKLILRYKASFSAEYRVIRRCVQKVESALAHPVSALSDDRLVTLEGGGWLKKLGGALAVIGGGVAVVADVVGAVGSAGLGAVPAITSIGAGLAMVGGGCGLLDN